MTTPRTHAVLARVLLGLLGIGLLGCGSSRPSQQVDERMRAVGTWAYRATGVNSIQQGRLEIRSREGELVGQFRDRIRGKVEADIQLQGAYMEIRVDQLRITGRILDNQYSGEIEQSTWDVTRQQPQRQIRARFEARRIGRPTESNGTDRFGCPSLLREESYACSPLHPR